MQTHIIVHSFMFDITDSDPLKLLKKPKFNH